VPVEPDIEPGVIFIYIGQPDATFVFRQQLQVPRGQLSAILVDLDIDRDMDLLISDNVYGVEPDLGSMVLTFVNNGAGAFTPGTNVPLPVPIYPQYRGNYDLMTITDMSGDRIPDLVALGEETGFAVAIGDGEGGFSPLHFFGIPVWPDAIVGDFDRDNDGDFVAIVQGTTSLGYVENRL
jgi:hypothetical protein